MMRLLWLNTKTAGSAASQQRLLWLKPNMAVCSTLQRISKLRTEIKQLTRLNTKMAGLTMADSLKAKNNAVLRKALKTQGITASMHG